MGGNLSRIDHIKKIVFASASMPGASRWSHSMPRPASVMAHVENLCPAAVADGAVINTLCAGVQLVRDRGRSTRCAHGGPFRVVDVRPSDSINHVSSSKCVHQWAANDFRITHPNALDC